jgi:putative transcriptional regulator
MAPEERDYPTLVKEVRNQLGLSQEDLARELGVSFATVNRWENGQSKPSKLAKAQLDAFCAKRIKQGSLKLPQGLQDWRQV